MDHRLFSSPLTLNDCIQTVIEVAHAHRLRLRESVLGKMVRVHLGQTVLMTVAPPPMPDLLTSTPLEALLTLPEPGGNYERAVRCVRLGRHSLVLFSLLPGDERRATDELCYAGTMAYKLAADAAASHDRWSGDLWWELGANFQRYSQIVAASTCLLDSAN